MNESPVGIGELLAGKYRVERVLGSGGMGLVVAAIHEDLGQRVALKFLLPQALTNAEAAQRFIREARAAVRIESEHVARVIDVGRLDNGAPYMVMEYLDGTDLSLYTSGRLLPIDEAVDFVLQACEAMAVAHAGGIIHRDLKPANLFVTTRPDGSPLVKVLDFGISKITVVDGSAHLTNTSAIMGSPLYMSPEQVRSARRVDARTDIWSLGVILYELLTGALPFEGESLGEVLTAVVTTTPRSLRSLRPEVPAGLEVAVLRALEKPLDRRYANVGELAAALIEFAPARSRVLLDRVSGVMSRAGFSSAPPAPLGGEKTVAQPPSELPRPPALPASVVPAAGTNASWVGGATSGKAGRLTPILLGGVAAIFVIAGVAAFARFGSSNADKAAASGSPAIAAVPVAPPEAHAVTGSPSVAAEPTTTVVTVADAGASSKETSPRAASAVRVASKPSSAAAHRPTPAPTVVASPAAPVPVPVPSQVSKKNPLNIQFK